jgi:predicted nuclease of restriction endonuclease-like (RecB) superfamily
MNISKKQNIESKNNFEQLVEKINLVHVAMQRGATNAVNQYLSVRNWLFGYYIVEFEQNGEDRALYGENLIANITKRVKHIKGLSGNQLYVCRNFYLLYPNFLRTVSVILQTNELQDNLLLSIQPTLSVELQNNNSQTDIILRTPSVKSEYADIYENDLPPELLLSRLSFSHFIELLRVNDDTERLFYEVETIKNNWSVRELKRAINTDLPVRAVLSKNKESIIAKIKNLKPQSNSEIIRNPYVLEFLDLEEKNEYNETDLEQAILNNLQKFLTELGTGFCFEARQKRITFNNKHYRIDLVFYHRILKCHILFDLKIGEFDHADAGQMNMYLNYYKKNEMATDDNPPIGIILCKDKDETLVEYSTADMNENLFVSKYLVNLPDKKTLQKVIAIND